MSDTFDHMGDAYRDIDRDYGEDIGNAPNPLFYHTCVTFIEIMAASLKAYKIRTKLGVFWIARSLCRNLDLKTKSVYIHKKSYLNQLRQLKSNNK